MPLEATNKTARPERTLEISFPQGIQHYITPLSILVTTTFVCMAIALSFHPSIIRASINDDSPNYEYLKGFKLGSSKGIYESFTEYDNEVCKEDEKPVLFMFSASWCPHCKWIGGTFNEWAEEQDNVVVYHWEVDTGDNLLTDKEENNVPKEAMNLYKKFNPGQSIPTFVFGCKYGRIGNGYEGKDGGLEKELETFDAIVDKL